jgi:hypothetical protein
MKKKTKKATKKIAKKIGTGAGIVGGVVAAGYAASKLLRHREEDTPEKQNLRDADRALDYEPGGNFSYAAPARDVGGDPSARTSVGLETGGGI